MAYRDCAAAPTLRCLVADQGYTGAVIQWAKAQRGLTTVSRMVLADV